MRAIAAPESGGTVGSRPSEAAGSRLAVLAFHKIGDPAGGAYPTWNYVPGVRFVELLRWLHESDWTVIDFATFIRGLSEPGQLPRRSVLLTFDDGYRSMLTEALPCLRRFGCPAVLFMPTGFVGGRNDFDTGIEPEEVMCDWADLRALEREGVSVQSHGVTHRAFSSLGQDELVEELVLSKAVLEARLEKPIEAIAYPYGDAGGAPMRLAPLLYQAGYRAGFLYTGGPTALPIGDRFSIARLALGPDSDLPAMLGEGG